MNEPSDEETWPPVVLRNCGWPNCPDSFDMVAQMGDGPHVTGWLRSPAAGYLCPDHGASEHVPTIGYGENTAHAVCGCGWTDEPQPTLGHVARGWQRHVEPPTAPPVQPQGDPR